LRRDLAAISLALLALTPLAGCGYTAGSLIRSDVQTISVGVIENLTFRRDLELDLTRALKQELRRKTHLRLVPGSVAESALTGTIVEVEERVLSEGDDDEVLEERITVTVRIVWTRRDGEVLLELPRVRGSAEFATGRGEEFREGAVEALGDLAERIVQLMEDHGW
jgi:hypothetical protein